ncbi:leukosialin-like [Brachyistius frenatus]|uniref:leukosialin-like n=1 Tax=Brachyistius frenatus TaxID=100188 RepID=UPI0037E7DF8D
MTFEINLLFGALVVLTGSSQTRGQSNDLPPVFTPAAFSGTSASPDLTEDPGNKVTQRTRDPAGRDEPSTETTTIPQSEGTVRSDTMTNAVLKTNGFTTSSAAPTSQHTHVPVVAPTPSAAADSLSSTPTVPSSTPPEHLFTTEGRALLTGVSVTTFSSQLAHTAQDASSTASTTQPHSESTNTTTTQTTGRPLTSAPGRAPPGPTHQEVPSELNVGDEDLKRSHYRSSSPLDPLLAGLLSVFIITTAIVFVILFLKFRQRTNHPEFHRLQDLPMDDLMEDTPLSRYTY